MSLKQSGYAYRSNVTIDTDIFFDMLKESIEQINCNQIIDKAKISHYIGLLNETQPDLTKAYYFYLLGTILNSSNKIQQTTCHQLDNLFKSVIKSNTDPLFTKIKQGTIKKTRYTLCSKYNASASLVDLDDVHKHVENIENLLNKFMNDEIVSFEELYREIYKLSFDNSYVHFTAYLYFKALNDLKRKIDNDAKQRKLTGINGVFMYFLNKYE